MSELLELPFDQYQRYALVRDLLASVREPGQVFRVLDVGGRTALLREFLPDDRVDLVDVEPSDAEGLVLGSGARLPFATGSFDVVAAFDTLEHVPPPLRDEFVAECTRVARRHVFLAGPYDAPRVAEAEALLQEFLRRRLNWEHRYLEEHRDHGLPCAATTRRIMEDAGARVEAFGHGALDRWLALMVIELYVEHEPLLREIAPRVYRLYNEHLFATDAGDDVYRHAVVAALGDAPIPSLPRPHVGVSQAPPELTRAFVEIGQEFARYDCLRDTYEPEMERLHGVVKSLEKDLAEHRKTLEVITHDRDESVKTIEALRSEIERERREIREIVAAKDAHVGGLASDLEGHRQTVAELRRLQEAAQGEVEVRGAELDRLREELGGLQGQLAGMHEEHERVHSRLHDALLQVEHHGDREARMREDLAEAFSGTEDRRIREELLEAQPLSVEDEIALLVSLRDRRRSERDEAREQIAAVASELARERELRLALRGHATSLGAKLWRAITFRPIDPELLED